MSRPQIILTTGPLGGTGDHAVYTTLPERYSDAGFDVYLDQDNLTRNQESHDLLWGKNPFILGTSNKKPNAGYVMQGRFYDVANRFPIGSIEAMERAHGLLPPYSLAPRIYYKPEPFRINLEQCVLVDFSAISSTITPQGMSDMLTKMNDRFPGKQFYMVTFPDGVSRKDNVMEGPSIQMNSIYEYVDAMASCYAWVGSEAGGQALAAAVRGEHDVYDLVAKPEIICAINKMTYNSRGYTFRGVDYRLVTPEGPDYFTPSEVAFERYNLMCRRTVEDARNEWNKAREDKAARELAG